MDEVESLIARLSDPDYKARDDAASRLGKMQDLRAVVPLIAALKDDNILVRSSAATALMNQKDERALPLLIDAINEPKEEYSFSERYDISRDSRTCILNAICSFGELAIPLLVRKLENEPFHVILDAAKCLHFLGLEKIGVRERLICQIALSGEYKSLKLEDAAIPHLLEFLSHKEQNFRICAAKILDRIGLEKLGMADQAHCLLLVEMYDRFEIDPPNFTRLRALGDAGVMPLIGMLGDRDEMVRRSAAEALTMLAGDSKFGLDEVASSIRAVMKRAENDAWWQDSRRLALGTYRYFAWARSRPKNTKVFDDGLILEGETIRPKKDGGMFRQRRLTHG